MRIVRWTTILLLGCWASTALAGPDRASWFQIQKQQARKALEQLQLHGSARVVWPAHRSRPAMIRGLAITAPGNSDIQRARNFLKGRPALFAGAGSRLAPLESRSTRDLRVVRFRQLYRGIPVEHARITVALNRAGQITSVHSEVEPVLLRSGVKPRISRAAAVRAALAAAGARPVAALTRGLQPSLVILPGGRARLVYKVMLPLSVNPAGRWFLVDAHSGTFVGWRQGLLMDGQRPASGVRR